LDDPLVAVFEDLGGAEVVFASEVVVASKIVVASVDCVVCGESVSTVKVRVPCMTHSRFVLETHRTGTGPCGTAVEELSGVLLYHEVGDAEENVISLGPISPRGFIGAAAMDAKVQRKSRNKGILTLDAPLLAAVDDSGREGVTTGASVPDPVTG